MRQLYNEGRVVGLSAYELFVRQSLVYRPEGDIPTEREWLADTLAGGNSMILKVAQGTTAGSHDYPLPTNCRLCGCSTVYASLFEGEVEVDDSGFWATRVTSYGKLVSNTEESHPETPGQPEDVPTQPNPVDTTSEDLLRSRNYSKILSGLVFQPGTWTQSGSQYVLEPDLSEQGFIRLGVTATLTCDVYILITGLIHKDIVWGATEFDDPSVPVNPESGSFLGPEEFPWSCELVLIATNRVKHDIYDEIYPVGSIYMSVNSANPSVVFPGTEWEAWGQGRVPIGVDPNDAEFNAAEKTGGQKSHDYTPQGSNSGCAVAAHSYTPSGTVSQPTFTGTAATLSHSGGAVQGHALTAAELAYHNHSFSGTAVNTGDALGDHRHPVNFDSASADLTAHAHYTALERTSNESGQESADWGLITQQGANGVINALAALGQTGVSLDVGFARRVAVAITNHADIGDNMGRKVSDAFSIGGSSDIWHGSHRHAITGFTDNTSLTHSHSVTAAGTVGYTGSGSAHTHPFTQPTAHSYTPAGTVSQPTFTGHAATLSHTVTQPTFTGVQATFSHMQPWITCYMWKRTA